MLDTYAQRRSWQHKAIKFGVLAAVCISFFVLTAQLGNSTLPNDSIENEHNRQIYSSDLNGYTSLWSASRELKASESTCTKPGSRGTQTQICAYLKENCPKDAAGYFDYLDIFYCSKWLGGNRALAWVTFVAWILFLFFALGTISNDYFVPALTSVSYTLSIPAEIAGLTLLAFGNGAPNVAGYFAAVSNNTFDLAIGDVFGGTFFTISVILSSVCIFGRNILVDGHSFVRDILFLSVACIAVFIFIWTGRIYIYESIALLVFYIGYVLWASIHDLMRQRKERLALKRARAAAGLPMPVKRSYRSRSSIFRRQSIARIDIGDILSKDSQQDEGTNQNAQNGNLPKKRPLSSSKKNFTNKPPKKHFDIDVDKKLDLLDDVPHTVGFSDAVSEVEVNLTPADTSAGASDEAMTEETQKEAVAPKVKPTFSTRTLRAAFAKVRSPNLIGTAVASELNADVEDILAPPLTGTGASDNAKSDGSMIIPNVHLYQEAIEEEIQETEKKGAYIWTPQHWWISFCNLALLGKLFYIITYPLNVPLFLSIPTTRWNRATALASVVLGWPVIFIAVGKLTAVVPSNGLPIVTICIAISTVLMIILFFLTETTRPPRLKIFFLFWAFVICVAWIYLIANELVNVLQAVGRILSIPDILLGATVLTWGNSVSDFVADSALSARGEARIAMGALYGGPMFST